ncbi:MAG: hypothetical protein J6Z04_05260 [Clostridia bacterium]|nr:hypothetical protein [Clostridia bacterium]
MNSYVHKSYFESGDGLGRYQYNVSYSVDAEGVEVAERGKDGGGQDLTTDDGCAFEIKYPVQLFYFAWLQYLGYFNQPETDEGEETGAVKQVYFYLSADLDMTGWTLPPIGTSTYPFVGNFDGNGHTIFNLTVQNVDTSTTLNPEKTLTTRPVDSISGAEIIGFFGVIGSMNNNGKVYGAIENDGEFVHSEFESYSYSGEINQVKNFTLDGVTVNTETEDALIGAIAGYVNGTVSNTAVSDTDVVVKAGTGVLTFTENVSDHSLVGYCTDACKFTLNVSRVTLHTPGETQNIIYKSTQGEGAGFGGSIQMKTIHERIANAATVTPSGAGTYVTAQRVVRDADGRILSITPTDYANISGLNNYRYYAAADSGYYYRYRQSNTYDQYLYITQESMTVTNIRYTRETESGYTVSDAGGTYYLNLNDDADGLTTDGDASTGWVYANNRIYTYSEVDGAKHYLNGTTTLSVDTTASTSWTWNNNRFSYTYNGMTYYLQYSGGWTVVPEYYYLISDGSGNYLRYNNGLVNTTNSAQASHWTFSTSGANPSGYISTTVGNTTYYLRYNNGLTTTTTANNATSWTNNGTGLYNGSNYIRFNGTSWIAGPRGTYYAIRNGANYLNITAVSNNVATVGTGTSVADVSLNGHTLWTFSSTAGNPSGTVSATVNGTTYYLNDSAGTLTATTANNTSWSNDGTSIKNGTDYLAYNGGWTIEVVNQMAIKSGNSYLNITGTNGTNATLGTGNSAATGSVSGHTLWTVSNSGQIYAVANGNTYYLRNNNGTLSATTTNSSGWTVDATHISNGNYYLYYDATTWKLANTTSELLGYTIDYNENYLNLTSTSTNTNNPIGTGTNVADLSYNGHTVWTFETTGTYPSGRMSVTISGTRYYLYGNSNNQNNRLRIDTSPTASYANWTNSSGKLQVRSRYLRYNNGWQHSTTNSNNTLNFTPIYASVTLETGSAPSVTVTSETEPVPSVQAGRVDSSISALTRSATDVSVLTRDPDTKEASSYYAAMPINAKNDREHNDYSINVDTNTGYIVSGNYSADQGNADIRISYYAASSISTATNGSYSPFTTEADARMEVITALSNDTYSGWYRVKDNVNENNTSFATNITNAVSNDRRKWYTELGLKRYEDARDSMTKTLVGSSNVYGLHFMDASIDINHLITLPEAHIEGETYYNYQVPNDCIDFNVKRRGYITVFAGTYFTQGGNNNTFFSLHEIERYEETDPWVVAGIKAVHDIKSIKEISKIYRAAEGSDFIYQYTAASGGGYSSAAARGTLAFDMEWMTNPEASKFVMNAVYYFEIPVNGGEFALGSVPDKRGAYLFYLDIAANAGTAEDKDRVTVTEKIKDESYSVSLPRGVQLVESGNAYDASKPYEFATFALKSGFSGTYPLVRTGTDVLYTENTYAKLTYIGATLSAGTDDGEGGTDPYAYYPNGYVIRYLEHVTDKGRDTDNYDHFLIETIDAYDSAGTRTGRTVRVYADVENLEVNDTVDEADLDLIITFTYDPAGHSGMKTRVVRAVSEGGFNISFDQNVTIISASITSEAVHVNFGDNTASTLITASAATPLAANTVVSELNMSGLTESTVENKYFASVYGPNAVDQPAEIATYFYYYEGSGVSVTPTTAITMPQLDTGNAAQARNLTYAVTLTPGDGVSSVKVYGKRLLDSYTYSTKVLNETEGESIVDSGTVTVTVSGVTVNGTSLGTTNTEITINGS